VSDINEACITKGKKVRSARVSRGGAYAPVDHERLRELGGEKVSNTGVIIDGNPGGTGGS